MLHLFQHTHTRHTLQLNADVLVQRQQFRVLAHQLPQRRHQLRGLLLLLQAHAHHSRRDERLLGLGSGRGSHHIERARARSGPGLGSPALGVPSGWRGLLLLLLLLLNDALLLLPLRRGMHTVREHAIASRAASHRAASSTRQLQLTLCGRLHNVNGFGRAPAEACP